VGGEGVWVVGLCVMDWDGESFIICWDESYDRSRAYMGKLNGVLLGKMK
jgi:hypothetical protein